MTVSKIFLLLLLPAILVLAGTPAEWTAQKHKTYTLHYTHADDTNSAEYSKIIYSASQSVENFFGERYKNSFDIYIHPDRSSIDAQWQKDWKLPEFKSECWMVASGAGSKLDIISPKLWDKESCEHHYKNTLKTHQLVAHELVHVYHGQWNKSPDFSNVTDIDWFVEGLAVYVSGQCDSERTDPVKKAIIEKRIPVLLKDFWSGKNKYGLSGSVIMYIDVKYGRNKLKELLRYNTKDDILHSLNTSEGELLSEWKKFMIDLTL